MTYHPRTIASPDEIERLLHHMPTVASSAQNTWTAGFARSVTKQSRHKGWAPSPKQLGMMRKLVSDQFTLAPDPDQEGDIQLIE
jgi:hypothetical protein